MKLLLILFMSVAATQPATQPTTRPNDPVVVRIYQVDDIIAAAPAEQATYHRMRTTRPATTERRLIEAIQHIDARARVYFIDGFVLVEAPESVQRKIGRE